MFWGLIMEPNKRYTQTVEKSFHVSMASLDLTTTSDDKAVQVMLCFDTRNYLLCTLNRNSSCQVPLDLNFQKGTKIAFTCNGHAYVHLTGYLIEDDDLDLDELEEEEEDEEDEEIIPQLIGQQCKRKQAVPPKDDRKIKRQKQEHSVKNELEDLDDDNDSEESSTEESSAEETSFMTNDDLEEDIDSINEEEEEDDSEEEEEQEEKKATKTQKQEKIKQQQKQKQDKKNLLNGKEAKLEQKTKKDKKSKPEQQQNQINNKQEQKKRVIEGGIQIEETKIGNGAPAKAGKFVSVYYIGRLKNGKKFDATTHGEGFKFRLGKGEVIKGWDLAIAGMKVGGKRKITIPPGMAYGAKGSPPVIPPNSTLIFDVELKNIH
ncbi:46 kDa FK506-binding nuclear protein [Prorops nasuta]|uniref:46 kDa FK506-binding nuclear protein n=1 Tax=Prorops nasuta TaxID=863751 RepID=UPI0034CD0BF1